MTPKSNLLRCLALLIPLALAPGVNARADVVALAITPNPSNMNNGNAAGPFSLGWEFTMNSNENVTQLGYFANTGLAETHNVAIYNVIGGALVASSTVSGADPLIVNFRYHALASPVLLTAGTQYWIMGQSQFTDPWAFQTTSLSTNPALTYVGSGFAVGNTDQFPTTGGPGNSIFGPNFQFTVPLIPSTPEPSSLTLCSLTAIGGLVIAWRNRRRVA